EVRQPRLWVVVAGAPHRGAARLPGVARPGLVARLTGSRDGGGLPQALARGSVEGLHEAADAALPAGDADHHLALDDQGRQGDVVADRGVLDLLLPHDLAGAGVERYHERIEGAEVDVVTVEADAAVGRVDLCRALWQLALVRSEEHTSELQSRENLVGRLLLSEIKYGSLE